MTSWDERIVRIWGCPVPVLKQKLENLHIYPEQDFSCEELITCGVSVGMSISLTSSHPADNLAKSLPFEDSVKTLCASVWPTRDVQLFLPSLMEHGINGCTLPNFSFSQLQQCGLPAGIAMALSKYSRSMNRSASPPCKRVCTANAMTGGACTDRQSTTCDTHVISNQSTEAVTVAATSNITAGQSGAQHVYRLTYPIDLNRADASQVEDWLCEEIERNRKYKWLCSQFKRGDDVQQLQAATCLNPLRT
eukprot:TRINITY_DN67996_c6_g1_i1.p1 TRINITY_DN67996_c6_g1~~TRINITY_DN67996_c6_g1_i1.p1  ORF type:complete len:249 (-),score=16.26 TRINITY_DN67996_c6_g1_i1:124-870(-)